ncbi:DUF4403 family protein [Algoriphagus formosus]|uniref:DUF4403 family protein n=1 Tax=Algoriphagus formosus TaxID=2007308 RepID=A0A4R5UYD2_9BACT|nr:DUF4403 family protein [Algoriphagus aquimaris]TDK44231.1 DUF4403 family protein [Algoriphagus aquimaris]
MRIKNATYLQKYSLLLISSLFFFFSCKSLDISSPGASPTVPEALSEVSLPAQMPEASFDRLINSQLPQILVEEDDLDLGNGLEGNLQIRRAGKVTWKTLSKEHLELRIPLQIQGEVGLNQGGLGSLFRRRVPLDENFAPLIRINPEVNPNWSLSVHDFELVELGGDLTLEVLGIELDLTGTLERQIRRWAAMNLGPERELVQLKPWIDILWQQVGKPFEVSWENQNLAFSIQPQEVGFDEQFSGNNALDLFLGLKGKIQSHPVEAKPSRAFPLPDLTQRREEKNLISARVPIGIGYEFLDQELGNFLGSSPIRVDKKTTMQLSNLQTGPFGELLMVRADFLAIRSDGEQLDGEIYVVGKPSFDQVEQQLELQDINFKVVTESTKVKWAVAFKKGKIIRRIERQARFPIDELLQSTLDSFQGQLKLETPIADLRLEDLSLAPGGFYPLVDELLIHMLIEGKVDIVWK